MQLLKTDCARGRWRQRGKSFPLGATLVPGGANFSVFAKHSTAVQLLLFDGADAANPSRVIDPDPRTNRTYHYWHAFVPGVTAGQSMVTTSPGLSISRGGFVSTPTSYCSTPTADASPADWSQPGGCSAFGNNAATALRSVVVDQGGYDREGDAPPGRPFAKTIIHEIV